LTFDRRQQPLNYHQLPKFERFAKKLNSIGIRNHHYKNQKLKSIKKNSDLMKKKCFCVSKKKERKIPQNSSSLTRKK